MLYLSVSTICMPCVVATMVYATLIPSCVEAAQFQGHLKPLGSYPPLHEIPVMEGIPTPQYFYEWFVRPGQPVLLRSALNNPGFHYPAYQLWTDDYLRRRFGHLAVSFEHTKKETRSLKDVDEGLFKTFLNQYNTSDVYLVLNLEHGSAMAEDIFLPSFVACGGAQKLLAYSHLWFSSGGTKSVLHFDSLDNINCLLDGTKDFIFIDKRYKPQIEASGFNSERGFSTVDVDRVDLNKFPEFKSVPWLRAQMKKGDCLFIPTNWYHQVCSHQGRNLAVNVWFEHPLWFNSTDCEMTTQRPLSEVPHVNEQDSFRNSLFAGLNGKDHIHECDLLYMVKNEQDAKQVYDYFNTDGDDHVSWEELYQADVDDFLTRLGDSLAEEVTTDIEDSRENQEEVTTDIEDNLENQEEETTDIEDNPENQEEETTDIDDSRENQEETTDIEDNLENQEEETTDIEDNLENQEEETTDIEDNLENQEEVTTDIEDNLENQDQGRPKEEL